MMNYRSAPRYFLSKPRSSLHRSFSFALPTPRKLDEISAVEKLRTETPNRIEYIWTEHHRTLPASCARVLKPGPFQSIMKKASECPFFIYPVFGGSSPSEPAPTDAPTTTDAPVGHYIVLSQFQDSNFLITFLEDYKKNPSTASPMVTVALYRELVEDKGLALVRADFLPSVKRQEAEALLTQVLESYGAGEGEEAAAHLHNFNRNPAAFDFNKYMQHCTDKYRSLFLKQEPALDASTTSPSS